mmetsp:Transcript_177/g.328  ORF Transcript_177/g.328 Transcript_177/m.328 type:complete len:674 (+) Transcript_177:146-2167(+)|eukprot:CAMPEP_0194094620 /NCGR_PEP_ID=MMETSP0149-20130528/54861_1 /TAXON_ID=122233 /ORGANISM="Chaetoceros debilis, Strain MM31A-1" /LENGTH=673 /DNA_ID=CAMNT_0038780353 /DNA_START=76 /DNA_END=2097 /DNA_ORIENTATION=+
MGENGSRGDDGLHVVISASGRVDLSSGDGNGQIISRLIHAISVSQPVQSWTVIRDHVDFITLGEALSTVIAGVPPCPSAPDFGQTQSGSSTEVDEIMKVRNNAQTWLNNVLLFPGSRESPAVRQFLCFGANSVPAQYQGINWITFNASSATENTQQHDQSQQQQANTTGAGHGDQFDMEDMFDYDDGPGEEVEEEDDYDDDGDFYSATERYQPTEEKVTPEDMMEFQNNADDVEMIEDVGSLAQSMGASHLGRSLQLQAQLSGMKDPHGNHAAPQAQQALNIGRGTTSSSLVGSNALGGIGSAVEKAGIQQEIYVDGLSDSFLQKAPVSAPRLDSFKMIKVVGKGSFGKVFLVREIKTSEMFALKVLRKDNIIKRNQVEHTRTERSVLGYVSHPFIVGLKMAFQSKDRLYFVLDYCAGGELFFHLSKVGKFSEGRAAFYAAEIVLALEYIHQLDIVYRDLKPENVLLDARGHVRLTDFGLSKEGITNSSSGANSFCGTPEYLAPEILNRQGHGRAVDWWSLGALFYEMLTGLPPFYCRDRERLFEKIRRGHLEYPRSLSARSQTLLMGLLTKDPTKRLGSGSDDAVPIKHHLFFTETDWVKLAKGEVKPPWDPQINNSLDTSQFDEEFTSMPMFSPSSYQPQAGFGATPQDKLFEGFTFTDNRFHAPPGTTGK